MMISKKGKIIFFDKFYRKFHVSEFGDFYVSTWYLKNTYFKFKILLDKTTPIDKATIVRVMALMDRDNQYFYRLEVLPCLDDLLDDIHLYEDKETAYHKIPIKLVKKIFYRLDEVIGCK